MRSGWLTLGIASCFTDYAWVVYERLDGRVRKWVTLKEPWVVTDGGYLTVRSRPGTASIKAGHLATPTDLLEAD